MQMATGQYTGNGSDNRNVVTGLSFQPAFVFIYRVNANYEGVIRWAQQTGDQSFNWAAGGGGGGIGGSLANGIQALNSDGFQIGSSSFVNNNTHTYRWMALEHDPAVWEYGTYNGNSSTRTISTTLRLDWIGIFATTSIGSLIGMHGMRTLPSTSPNGETFQNNFTGGTITTAIRGFGVSTGFELGNYVHVNRTGDTYHWFGFKNTTGNFFQGTFTGNGADNRNISMGDPFQPEWFMMRARGAVASPNYPWIRHPNDGGGDTSATPGLNPLANYIQALNSTGFQVGTSMDTNTETYHYVAFKHKAASVPLTALPAVPVGGGGYFVPTAPYTKYKTARQATQIFNNLIIGP